MTENEVASALIGLVVLCSVAPIPVWLGFAWIREASRV